MNRGLASTGVLATLAVMAAAVVVAALARAAGVDFAVSNSEETIPVSGIAVVTGFFSVVGVLIAAGLRRWSPQPDLWFVCTAITLTAISLVPPVLLGADAATSVTLVGLHLVAATVMIPTLARILRGTA